MCFVLLLLRHTVEPAVDVGHLFHPIQPLAVFQFEDVVERPMKVISQIGYLLTQAFEGVAYDPPSSVKSTSCWV